MKLKKCNYCNKLVKFKSIEETLGATLKKYNFPYGLGRFETLNYKAYNCPNCGSSDRDRLYKLYFEKYEVDKEIKLVDFAPSKNLAKFLKGKKNINYRSADLMMDGVDDVIDITDMKTYKDGSFDFFVCSHIIEHVDDKKALSELYRILKNNGRGILMTPIMTKEGVFDEDLQINNEDEQWRRFAQGDHVRLYEKKVFIDRTRYAGFKIKELTVKDFGKYKFYKHGISPKSVLYIVIKEE